MNDVLLRSKEDGGKNAESATTVSVCISPYYVVCLSPVGSVRLSVWNCTDCRDRIWPRRRYSSLACVGK